jgi:hypothetical protein
MDPSTPGRIPAGSAGAIRDWAFRWIGPALFVVLWWASDLGQVRALAGRAVAAPMAAAAALNLVIIVLKAWRWREIMKVQAIPYPFAGAVRAYTIASALAAWTPGRLGDFSKALSVSRERTVSFGRAASSVIADRLLDVLALTLVAAGGAYLLGPVAGTVTWCLAALACVVAWILYRWATTEGHGRAGRALGRVGLARAGRQVEEALAGLGAVAWPSWPRALAAVAPATVAATLLTFLQGFLVARGLMLSIPFWRLAAALGAASLASLLPLSVSGIGIREAAMMLYLAPAGLGLPEVLTFSVAFLIVVNGSAAFLGAATHAAWPSPARTAGGGASLDAPAGGAHA